MPKRRAYSALGFPGTDGGYSDGRPGMWRLHLTRRVPKLITSDAFAGFVRLEIHSMFELTLQRGREDSP